MSSHPSSSNSRSHHNDTSTNHHNSDLHGHYSRNDYQSDNDLINGEYSETDDELSAVEPSTTLLWSISEQLKEGTDLNNPMADVDSDEEDCVGPVYYQNHTSLHDIDNTTNTTNHHKNSKLNTIINSPTVEPIFYDHMGAILFIDSDDLLDSDDPRDHRHDTFSPNAKTKAMYNNNDSLVNGFAESQREKAPPHSIPHSISKPLTKQQHSHSSISSPQRNNNSPNHYIDQLHHTIDGLERDSLSDLQLIKDTVTNAVDKWNPTQHKPIKRRNSTFVKPDSLYTDLLCCCRIPCCLALIVALLYLFLTLYIFSIPFQIRLRYYLSNEYSSLVRDGRRDSKAPLWDGIVEDYKKVFLQDSDYKKHPIIDEKYQQERVGKFYAKLPTHLKKKIENEEVIHVKDLPTNEKKLYYDYNLARYFPNVLPDFITNGMFVLDNISTQPLEEPKFERSMVNFKKFSVMSVADILFGDDHYDIDSLQTQLPLSYQQSPDLTQKQDEIDRFDADIQSSNDFMKDHDVQSFGFIEIDMTTASTTSITKPIYSAKPPAPLPISRISPATPIPNTPPPSDDTTYTTPEGYDDPVASEPSKSKPLLTNPIKPLDPNQPPKPQSQKITFHRHLPTEATHVAPYFDYRGRRWNISAQPLPPNPDNFRYIMTQRTFFHHPKPWTDAYGHNPQVSNHQTIATCFADWFPKPMIDAYISSSPVLGPNSKMHIDLDAINLDQLAGYYGYNSYQEMPYHPRIPFKPRHPSVPNLSSVNSTTPKPSHYVDWQLECVTAWRYDERWVQDTQPGYYKQFYPEQGRYHPIPNRRGNDHSGAEDSRLGYDRCGRLITWFGAYNDITPYQPNWSVFGVDLRRLENDNLLIKPFELCKQRYRLRTMTQFLDNQYDGHELEWEKNHNEITYGFSYGDIAAMVMFKEFFEKKSEFFDFRSNTYHLTQSQYDEIKQELLNPVPTSGSKSDRDKFHPVFEYLNSPPTIFKSVSPMVIQRGSVRFKEQIPTTVTSTPDYIETQTLRDLIQHQKTDDKKTWAYSIRSPNTVPIPDIDDEKKKKLKNNLAGINNMKNANSTIGDANTGGRLNPNITDITPVKLLHYPQTIPTGLNPETYISDLRRSDMRFNLFPGQAQQDNNDKIGRMSSFGTCLLKYQSSRPYESSIPYEASTNHAATNWLLVYISDEDWGFAQGSNNNTNPLPPHQAQYPNWVYISINHNKGHNMFYRPVVTFVNAITMELFAIQPIHFDNMFKCRTKNGATCPFGVGPGCGSCKFIYIHAIFANATPLSFSILDQATNNANSTKATAEVLSNQESSNSTSPQLPLSTPPVSTIGNDTNTDQHLLKSLHTVLPTYYHLDTQFLVSLNIDDKYAWMQEIDLRSIWLNRFSCTLPGVEVKNDVDVETEEGIPNPNTIAIDLDTGDISMSSISTSSESFVVQQMAVKNSEMPTRNSFISPTNEKGNQLYTPSFIESLKPSSKSSKSLKESLLAHDVLELRHEHRNFLDNTRLSAPHPANSAKWQKNDWSKEDLISVATSQQSPVRHLYWGVLQDEFEFWSWEHHYSRLSFMIRATVIPSFVLLFFTFITWSLWYLDHWDLLDRTSWYKTLRGDFKKRYQPLSNNDDSDDENHGGQAPIQVESHPQNASTP